MVVQEDIPMMELFRKSVNASREALAKVEVREGLTYHYAIVRVYSKMLVTSCAIYTLLINGYPDDAMALCRQLYESLVIIDTLLKGKQKNDTEPLYAIRKRIDSFQLFVYSCCLPPLLPQRLQNTGRKGENRDLSYRHFT